MKNQIMTRMLLIFKCLLVLPLAAAMAQTKLVDSLQIVVAKTSGNQKAYALIEFASALVAKDYEKGKQATKEAYQICEKLNDNRGMALALVIEARHEWSRFNYPLTKQLLQKSISLSRKAKANDVEGYAFANLGFGYKDTSQPDSATLSFNTSYQLLKDQKNPYYLSFLYLAWSELCETQGDHARMFTFLEKCWTIRKKNNMVYALPYIAVRLASYYVDKGEYENAHYFLDASQKALGADTVNNEYIAIIQEKRALVYSKEGKVFQAIQVSNKAREYYEKNNFKRELTQLLIEDGDLFWGISNYEASLKCLFSALQKAEEDHFELEKTKACLSIAWDYYELNDLKSAKKYNDQSMKLAIVQNNPVQQAYAYNLEGLIALKENRIADAKSNLRRSLSIRLETNDKIAIAASYFNIGTVAEHLHHLDSALFYYHKSEVLEEDANYALGVVETYLHLGSTYTKSGRFEKAEDYFKKGEALARKIKAGSLLIQIMEHYRDLLSKKGNSTAALKYAVQTLQLKDSIYNKDFTNRIAALENINELDQKNNEIQLLNKKRELQQTELILQEEKLQRQWFITAIITLVLVLLSAITFLLFRNNRQTNRLNDQLEKQNQKLNEAQQIIDQQNTEIKKRNKNLEEEVERRSRELVDYNSQLEQFAFLASHNLRAPVARILGLGQMLKLPTSSERDVDLIKEKLILTTVELDNVIKDLNTILDVKRQQNEILSHINMRDEIEWIKVSLEKEIAETGAVIETSLAVDTILSVRTSVDSILYNLLSNAIKYRSPQGVPSIVIKTEIREAYICLIVSDNGLGIDLAKHGSKLFTLHGRFHDHMEGRGLGLYMVKTQIQALDGKIEVESVVNNGTTFYIYFKK